VKVVILLQFCIGPYRVGQFAARIEATQPRGGVVMSLCFESKRRCGSACARLESDVNGSSRTSADVSGG
jgi:hypothetical protein